MPGWGLEPWAVSTGGQAEGEWLLNEHLDLVQGLQVSASPRFPGGGGLCPLGGPQVTALLAT